MQMVHSDRPDPIEDIKQIYGDDCRVIKIFEKIATCPKWWKGVVGYQKTCWEGNCEIVNGVCAKTPVTALDEYGWDVYDRELVHKKRVETLDALWRNGNEMALEL